MIPFPPSRAFQKIAKNTTMHVCTYHHISAFISFASLSLSLSLSRLRASAGAVDGPT